MRSSRLSVLFSATALVVAVLGATPVGEAARSVTVAFAQNAAKVGGFKPSKTSKKNTVVVRGANGKIDQASLPVIRGERGEQGPQGIPGPPGERGLEGPPNPNAVNAQNADRLDSLDSTDFLRSSAKASDSDRLDNLDSADFLRATAQAVDSSLLDGLDSLVFFRKAMMYQREATSTGTLIGPTARACVNGDDYCFLRVDCDSGDVLANGGYYAIDEGTSIEASYANTPSGVPANFIVRWHNDATADAVSVRAYCWNVP